MTYCDATHDPALKSWVASASGHREFPIQNLPFGIFSTHDRAPRAGVAIGDEILDLSLVLDFLPEAARAALSGSELNAMFALPKADRQSLRQRISSLLSDENMRSRVASALLVADDATLHLPASIGDYTDFYVGIHHAENIGKLFRPDNPLLPNYKWVPIGYHGRASSIRPSGVPVRRPWGQLKAADEAAPQFAPCRRLDYELEMGVWTGAGNSLGEPVPITEAWDHIAGLCLLNDWSARDVQAWEYQPLGPFLSKNFHSTISPWVVTAEALAPFRIPQAPRSENDPQPLGYLWDAEDQKAGAFAITLEVLISTELMRDQGLEPTRLSKGPASNMYWTVAQLFAHHTSNGCNLQPGDLLGTGTISGPTRDSFGSMMELSAGGKSPIILPTGDERIFLADGDEITLRARAECGNAVPIGFGDCTARISADGQ